jgi:hypothetical protein
MPIKYGVGPMIQKLLRSSEAPSGIRQIISRLDKVSEPPNVGLSKHTFCSEIAEQHGRFATQSEKLPDFKISTNKY